MSTQYYVYCTDCEEEEDTGGDIRSPGLCQERIDNSALIVAFNKAFPTGKIEISHYFCCIRIEFYEKHMNHKLTVRDCYGHFHEPGIRPFNKIERPEG